jgi:hypothetical protein
MSERSQFGLLGERRFGPFFAVPSAFNDNVFKQALLIGARWRRAPVGSRQCS